MLAEAGVPKMARHDIPSELLQPLVPRYEEALSQLEQAVKVRGQGVLMTHVSCRKRPDTWEGSTWPWEGCWGQNCTF